MKSLTFHILKAEKRNLFERSRFVFANIEIYPPEFQPYYDIFIHSMDHNICVSKLLQIQPSNDSK